MFLFDFVFVVVKSYEMGVVECVDFLMCVFVGGYYVNLN